MNINLDNQHRNYESDRKYDVKIIDKEQSEFNIERYYYCFELRNGNTFIRYWRLPEDLRQFLPMYEGDGVWYFKQGMSYDEESNILKRTESNNLLLG